MVFFHLQFTVQLEIFNEYLKNVKSIRTSFVFQWKIGPKKKICGFHCFLKWSYGSMWCEFHNHKPQNLVLLVLAIYFDLNGETRLPKDTYLSWCNKSSHTFENQSSHTDASVSNFRTKKNCLSVILFSFLTNFSEVCSGRKKKSLVSHPFK